MSRLISIDVILASILFVLALFPRLVNLGELPYGFWLDEPDYALAGLSLLSEQNWVPFTMKAIDGQMTPLLYLIALSVKTFGHTITAVRLPTALIASLTIPAFYLVSRLFVKRYAAAVATLLFTFSYWHIVFSRIAFQVPLLVLSELLVIGSLYLALREDRAGYWALAGVFLGLSLYTYTPARWFVILVFASIICLKIIKRSLEIGNWKLENFLFFLSFFLTASPLIAYTARYPNDILFRLNKLSILKASPENTSVLGELAINTVKNVGMFWLVTDSNGRHNPAQTAALDPITGVLFFLGILLAVTNRMHRRLVPSLPREPRDRTHAVIVLLCFLMLLPAILSFEGRGGENQPHMLRASGALPFVYLSIAYFLNWLLSQTFWKKRFIIVFALLGVTIFFNLRRFFATPLTPKLYYEMNVRESTVGQLVSQTVAKTIVLSPYFAHVPQVVFLQGNKRTEVYDSIKLDTYLSTPSILLILDVNRNTLATIEELSKKYPTRSRLVTTDWKTTEAFVYEQ